MGDILMNMTSVAYIIFLSFLIGYLAYVIGGAIGRAILRFFTGKEFEKTTVVLGLISLIASVLWVIIPLSSSMWKENQREQDQRELARELQEVSASVETSVQYGLRAIYKADDYFAREYLSEEVYNKHYVKRKNESKDFFIEDTEIDVDVETPDADVVEAIVHIEMDEVDNQTGMLKKDATFSLEVGLEKVDDTWVIVNLDEVNQ